MQFKNKAFSIVELLVVITIVGVLAAIAAPAYKNYLMRSRLSEIVAPMDALMEKAILYASTNGHFPNGPTQIGYPSDFTGENFANPSQVVPYATQLAIADYDAGTPGHPEGCGKWGFIAGPLDPVAVGLSGVTPSIYAECTFYHINGAVNKYCDLRVIADGHSLTGQFLPGWGNYYSNSTGGYLLYQQKGNALLSSATCM